LIFESFREKGPAILEDSVKNLAAEMAEKGLAAATEAVGVEARLSKK
jgi:hypothetical protein